MFGIEPQGLAAVDRRPDRRRLLPAKSSKISDENSSLHLMQAFRTQSGAGPLLGIADLLLFSSDDVELNHFFMLAGTLYHLPEDEVSFEFEFESCSFSPPNWGRVGPRTHFPKQFFAVFAKKETVV